MTSTTQDLNLETNLPVVISKITAAYFAARTVFDAVTRPEQALLFAGITAVGLYVFCSACQAAQPSKEVETKHPTFARRLVHYLIKPIELK